MLSSFIKMYIHLKKIIPLFRSLKKHLKIKDEFKDKNEKGKGGRKKERKWGRMGREKMEKNGKKCCTNHLKSRFLKMPSSLLANSNEKLSK